MSVVRLIPGDPVAQPAPAKVHCEYGDPKCIPWDDYGQVCTRHAVMGCVKVALIFFGIPAVVVGGVLLVCLLK